MADVLMPRLSDTMEEGTVTRWLKQPGEQVAKGDVIAEIQTDKANMDLEAYEEGTLERILVEEGTTVAIGEPIAVISGAERGEEASHPEAPPEPEATRTHPNGRTALITSPLARSLATRHGIDLAQIRGTGPGGRIIRADVEQAIAHKAQQPMDAPPPPRAAVPPRSNDTSRQGGEATGDTEEIPLNNVRRLTAQRLTLSAQAPHFYLTSMIDAEPLLHVHSDINQDQPDTTRVTVTDLLVKACAKALRLHPDVNSSWGEVALLRHHRVHVGVAVATPAGLVVPVVHDADTKTLQQIATESHGLSAAAREGKLSLDQMTRGTFTISNLGMYGVDHFTAIINPPQAAILAVGEASSQPVVRGGNVIAGTTMKLTLSIDHRVLDGAAGASFLRDLKSLLEHPVRILT